MQIEKDRVVSFHYRLSEGETELEQSHGSDPMLFLYGHGGLITGLEEEMAGREKGERFKVTLEPDRAYGPRNEQAVQRIPVKHLQGKKKLKAGDVAVIQTQSGPMEVVVRKMGRFMVDVDANHPLAGRTLTFDIEIVDVREATEEEIAHGHAHGAGGHEH